MKLLALDSSGLVASVAVMEEDNLIAEYTIHHKKTHSQTLLPMLEQVCVMTEQDLGSVDAVAVAAGPGSFTGLRIGSATAKGLGLALKIPVIPVPTLEALAYNLYGTDALVCPLMDARRGQVYTGIYEFVRKEEADREEVRLGQSYAMETLTVQCAVPVGEILDKLNRLGVRKRKSVIFTGDGIPVSLEMIREKLTVPWSLAPAGRNRQNAASLGALAQVYYRKGIVQTAAEHTPDYLRLSQAERERLEAQAAAEQP